MSNQAHHYALKALSAANLAPTLADEIQNLYEQQLAIANAKTIEQSKTLIHKALDALPPPLRPILNDNELTTLIKNLL